MLSSIKDFQKGSILDGVSGVMNCLKQQRGHREFVKVAITAHGIVRIMVDDYVVRSIFLVRRNISLMQGVQNLYQTSPGQRESALGLPDHFFLWMYGESRLSRRSW